MTAWVYILANRPNGAIYVGVTSDLAARVQQHRDGAVPGHTARYTIRHLVHAEAHDDIRDAIAREKRLKHWKRVWKDALIEQGNPDWRDLWEDLNL